MICSEHQAAGGVRQPLRHVVDARLLTVHHAEAVGHVRVGEGSELGGEGPALRVVNRHRAADGIPDVVEVPLRGHAVQHRNRLTACFVVAGESPSGEDVDARGREKAGTDVEP